MATTTTTASAPQRSPVEGARNADLAAAILRIAMGILFLAHAGLKLFVFTPAGTASFFASLGLPGPLAYLVIVAELFGGLALILGLYTAGCRWRWCRSCWARSMRRMARRDSSFPMRAAGGNSRRSGP